MWDLPRPGLEPVSPALAAGFLTTVPPGKPTTSVSQNQIHKGGEYLSATINGILKKMPSAMKTIPKMKLREFLKWQ